MVREQDRFQQAVEVVLKHEGGYVNDPTDPGGETNFGISRRSYPDLDIRNLTREQAIEIYRQDFWLRWGYDRIRDLGVATKVFDMAVNMGPRRAHRLLQQALGWVGYPVVVDGILGSETLTATNAVDPGRLLEALRMLAARYYWELVRADHRRSKFLAGWLARAYS